MLAVNGGPKAFTGQLPTWPIFGKEEEEGLLKALHSGHWGRQEGDSVVAKFEQRFAEAHDCKYGVACTNGTVALKLACMAVGVEAGDEVIVTPFTFLATASAVIEANATPIFADIEPDTYNIDPKSVEKLITPRTKAIIPVHLGGLPVNLDAIMAIAKKHGLRVIEDCCHAHGAKYKGKSVGSYGDIGVFSFQSSKNMSCGEGGALVTNDKELHHLLFSFHNCGREPGHPWYRHFRAGGNYRLSEFVGAILQAQLDRLEDQTSRRDANGRYLASLLEKIPGLKTQAISADVTRHAYHLFVIRYDASVYGVPREVLVDAAKAEGIPLALGYPIALYQQPMFREAVFGPFTGCFIDHPKLDYKQTKCPVCDNACANEALWLLHQNLLGDKSQMDAIAAVFQKLYDNRGELAEFAAQKAKA
ncbi:MAG: DegT/DnrJ/EryC1/StrS family aminotransferase [Candidatus Sumerlaeia bacterium]